MAFGTLKHHWKKVKHYADPRTHIAAVKSVAHHVGEFHSRAAHFIERQARKDYVKSNRYFAASAKIVTPILAAVASFIPVVGWVAGYVIAFAGAAIQRVSSGVEGRSKGIHGLENRQRARNAEHRTLKYGLIGAGIGNLVTGIVALIGSLTGTAAAAAGAGAAAEGAGDAAGSAAGEAAATGAGTAAPTVAASGEITADAGLTVGVPQVGNVVDVTQDFSAGLTLTNAPEATALETVKQSLVQPGLAAASGASTGILGTGISWGDLAKFAATIGPSLLKVFGPKAAAAPGVDPNALGTGGGSGGGEGDAGAGGGLADEIAGLPLWVKLGAGAVGAGALALAFTGKHRKEAA